jgi:hypothetical protein
MGYDVYYTATRISLGEEIHTHDKLTLVVAALDFENEHGYDLATVRDALVGLKGDRAFFVSEPAAFLPEDTDEKLIDKLYEYAENCPSYHVHNEKELAGMLRQEIGKEFIRYVLKSPCGYLVKIRWGGPPSGNADNPWTKKLEDARKWKTKAGAERYLKRSLQPKKKPLPPGLKQFKGLEFEVKKIQITMIEVDD